ncbi:hypothetical protein KR009_012088 [Drosophila setifemur]|nr:hypothetical protein KR009_012088 [Drosophila setifemur]
MSGSQQPGDTGAPAVRAGDPGSRSDRSASKGVQTDAASASNWRQRQSMKYNSQPRSQEWQNSGPYNSRGWANYNQRYSPYPRNHQSNYGSRQQFDSRSSHCQNRNQERQERDYTKSTDFQKSDYRNRQERSDQYPRNSRNREESPVRSRDHRYRDPHSKYQRRKSEEYHNDSIRTESSSHRQSRNKINEPEGNSKKQNEADRIIENDPSRNSVCIEELANKVDSKDQQLTKTNVEQSTAVSKEIITATLLPKDSTAPSKYEQANELKETLNLAQLTSESTIAEGIKSNIPTNEQLEIKSNNRSLSKEEAGSGLRKDFNNPSPTRASQPNPRIQVRPLTQLLKQEILAVTQEKRLGQRASDSRTSPTPIASPSRQVFKPDLRNRRRTISCNQNFGTNSSTQFVRSEASINNRIARLDKESLKYIINNSDTIYDEHLKSQARRRLRDEIRRQLKAIELEQPKDNPVTELVEDEIVDAIKLPELLLQEIEKCFGIDTSERPKILKQEEKSPEEGPNSIEPETEYCNNVTTECFGDSFKSNTEDTQAHQEYAFVKVSEEETITAEVTEEVVSEITCKGAEYIKDNTAQDSSFKGNNNSDNNINNISTDNINTVDQNNSTESSEEKNITASPFRKENVQIVRKNRKKSKKEARKKYRNGNNISKGIPQLSTRNTELAGDGDSWDSMDLMSRLKAANESNIFAKKTRPPLLPTPSVGISTSFNQFKARNHNTESFSHLPTNKSQEILNARSRDEISEIISNCESTTHRTETLSATDKIQETMNTSSVTGGVPAVPCSENIAALIATNIKRESSSSPIIGHPLSETIIELLSSSDEEEEACVVDMDVCEPEVDADGVGKPSIDLQSPEIDDAASDHSTCSQGSSESTRRRFKLKLQNDAENVVDSFEKLILPHLREALAERYRRQHSASLQSRLHFVSCVVTSSEHNPQTISKIEVAKIQRNLKATDNRMAIEFLVREIVAVVNLQKQRRREQEDNKQGDVLSSGKSETVMEETPQIASPPPVPQSPSGLTVRKIHPALSTSESPARHGSQSSSTRQSPPPLPSLPVSLPYLAIDSSLPNTSSGAYGYPVYRSDLSDPREPVRQTTQSLHEIDRRLLENQNRRSFLEEMIMKLQKEKSDLEMHSLELQNRKFLFLNSLISRNQSTADSAPPPPENSPSSPPQTRQTPPKASVKESIARRTRSRTRGLVMVKLMPKRKVRILKKISKAAVKSEELEQEEQSKMNKEQAKEKESMQISDVELQSESAQEQKSLAKVKLSHVSKPKASVVANVPQQQPLAIIPPLPPPPPPPEPICHLSYDLPHSLFKDPPPPPEHYSEMDFPVEQFNLGVIPTGRLHNITSPITQIRVYRNYVIAAAEDGDIYMFQLGSHKLERQITKHSEAITNMFLCERDSLLYTTSLDGFLKKSSLENLERVMQTVYFKEPLQSIDIAWGLAFIGSRWGNIFTFNIVTNKMMDMPLLSTGQSIIAVKATKEGVRKILVLGCKGNFIHMHDAGNGLLLRRLEIPEGLNVYSLLLNDGHIYCGTQKNQIYQFEFATGNFITKLSCGNGAVSIVPYKERYMLVGCYDGFIYVLNKLAGTQVGRFKGAGRLVLALAVAGDKIVTSSKDNSLEILDVPASMVNGQ